MCLLLLTRSRSQIYKIPNKNELITVVWDIESAFGGLEVACWPLVPKFAGSHPAEAVGFLRRKNSQLRLPSEGK